MLYALIGHDAPGRLDTRLSVRAEHLARVKQLQELGRLILAGPFPAIDSENPGPAGFSGSLIVAEFENLDAALSWWAADPYVTHGVFETTQVHPFKQVFP
jgi:uncharacterized protein YciI